MTFPELLAEHKLNIIESWVARTMGTYAAEGAKFFTNQKDQFANPVGFNAKKGLEKLFKVLAEGTEIEQLPSELMQFIKIRAVQDMTPARALGFLLELKGIVRDACTVEKLVETVNEWIKFEVAIDKAALLAFNLYMEDRELIYKVKVNEYKRGTHILAERGVQCPSAMMRQEEKGSKK